MKPVKLAAAVLNQTPLDWRGNRERIVAAISEARLAGSSVLCLPELCITGYGCEDAFHSPSVHRMAWRILHEIAPLTTGMVVTAGLPVMHRKGIFNFVCVLVDGKIAGFTGKRFLAGDGIHYEPRWFKPWPEGVTSTLEDDNGAQYPCGDIYYEIGGIRFGFEICEDAWVANRPGIALALRGVDVILNPSASHFAFDKHEIRKRFVLEGSRAFGVSYVYANLLGNESGRAIFDGEAMIATGGRLCAASERFSFQDLQIITAQVDVEAARMAQSRTSSYRPNLTAEEPGLVDVPFSWPALTPSLQKAAEPAWEKSEHLKAEEFSRAVPLALLDYMRKSRSRGFVVSLSGGADSAACTVLVRLMVELALKEIGAAGLRTKLAHIQDLANAETAEDFSALLLTTAYQASDNSGPITKAAARAVGESVGARHFEFNISQLVDGYVSMIEGGLGRKLTWQDDDIALQNIQARVRSPGIWMLANITGALLLSTSNRSEAAVGYATMDGDTSGGLAPISGIDKAWLRQWLTWMETTGPLGLHSFPALRAINVQAPTAELRPAENKQTDEDDLMPYPLLDAIERAGIRDKLAPVEIWQLMQQQFPQYDQKQLAAWVERFFTLWCRNQWKRERYAPGFHLDDENLDPKTWCRFPILSGGFAVELEELRALAAGAPQG